MEASLLRYPLDAPTWLEYADNVFDHPELPIGPAMRGLVRVFLGAHLLQFHEDVVALFRARGDKMPVIRERGTGHHTRVRLVGKEQCVRARTHGVTVQRKVLRAQQGVLVRCEAVLYLNEAWDRVRILTEHERQHFGFHETNQLIELIDDDEILWSESHEWNIAEEVNDSDEYEGDIHQRLCAVIGLYRALTAIQIRTLRLNTLRSGTKS